MRRWFAMIWRAILGIFGRQTSETPPGVSMRESDQSDEIVTIVADMVRENGSTGVPVSPVPCAGANPLLDLHFEEADASERLGKAMWDVYEQKEDVGGYVPVIFCVGATSSTGDSLGPFIGWFLRREGYKGILVGHLDDPAHAKNLREMINEAWLLAMKQGKYPLIFAFDAAVGRVGRITFNLGPLKPGAGMGKRLPEVGVAHIMAGVAAFPFMIWFTELGPVVGMAEKIAKGVRYFYGKYEAKYGTPTQGE